jgi:hypothetical protein
MIQIFAFNSDMFYFQYNNQRLWRGEIFVILQYHGIGNLRFFQVTSVVFLGTILEKLRITEVNGYISQLQPIIFNRFTL